MTETRKLAAILAADVVGYSRLMGGDGAGGASIARRRLRSSRARAATSSKTTGDGLLIEFPSVVAAVECAIGIQKLMIERNAGTPQDKRMLYRIGVNLGDVLIDGDDILGDGVNIAARLEGLCEPGGVLISGTAYDHVRGRIDADFVDLGEKDLKNIARPVRVHAVRIGPGSATPAPAGLRARETGPAAPLDRRPALRQYRRRSRTGLFCRRRHREPDHRPFADERDAGDRAKHCFQLQGQAGRPQTDRTRAQHTLRARRQRPALGQSYAGQCPAHRRRERQSSLGGAVRQTAWPISSTCRTKSSPASRTRSTPQLIIAEARRAERAPSPDSMDLYFQGMSAYNRGLTPDRLSEARRLFERALALDPEHTSTRLSDRRGLGRRSAGVGSFVDRCDGRRWLRPKSKLTKALSSVADHPRGTFVRWDLSRYMTPGAPREGIAECEHALALDRNLAARPRHSSDVVRSLSVAPKRRRLTSLRPCASARGIHWLTPG